MAEKPNELQFRLLLYYIGADIKRRTVSDAARALHKPKSTVVYALAGMQRMGLVQPADQRKTILTSAGIKVAQEYREKLEFLEKHMIFRDVSPEKAKADAIAFLTADFSDDYVNAVREEAERNFLKGFFSGRDNFNGLELCGKMKKGVHKLPFVLYRENARSGNNISMGNRGFENPASLIVNGEDSKVYLTLKTLSGHSAMDGRLMEGRINKLLYRVGNKFNDAETDGRHVYIPATALSCVALGSGNNMLLQCSTYLKLQCSVGMIHMPESKAILTLFIT